MGLSEVAAAFNSNILQNDYQKEKRDVLVIAQLLSSGSLPMLFPLYYTLVKAAFHYPYGMLIYSAAVT